MRIHFLSLVVASASVLALSGCSSKPENSPAIRTRFAQIDSLQDTLDQQSKEIAFLNEQVRRLGEENSELRSIVPGLDGSSIGELSTMEERLSKLETITADGVLTSAMASTSRATPSVTTTTAVPASPRKSLNKTVALDEASLATTKVAAVQQKTTVKPAVTKSTKPGPKSFKEMTSQKSTSKPAPKVNKSVTAPAKRGSYHVIQAGESVGSIAKQHKISVDALLKANRLPKGIRLGRGQRLFVPAQ